MLDLSEFQKKIKEEFEKSQRNKTVQVSGKNIDEALKHASIELSVPIKNIDYEILDKGSSGFFGIKARPCRIIAYQSLEKADKKTREVSAEQKFDIDYSKHESFEIDNDIDGNSLFALLRMVLI